MRFIAFLRIIALSVVGATGPGHPELKQLRTSCHNQPSTRVSVRLEKLFAAAVTEMNTLLGELATLNDVQYQRYRVAFKFRKLQKNLFLEYGTVVMLSEVLHLTGLQSLHHGDVVPLSQLSSALTELYGAIRTARPVLKPGQLQNAQDCAFNWFQIAYRTGSGETIDATHLKIALCIFLGSKVTEKARFIFGQLANANGAIEKDGMRLFVQVLQELAHALQENTYEEYNSLDKVFEESLVFVRDSEDVEEEQLDGGIRRQWLSQFEFTKLLTASPSPPFFSWLLLWFSLPTFETVVHSVRCSICARKPIVCFRYQCTQCHNYHMCQMCFLKGRSSDHHQISHKVLEFSNKGRGSGHSWHHRLLGLPHRGAGGRVVTEERRPFSFRPSSRASQSNSRNEETDTAMAALTDLMTNSRQINPVMNGERKGSHSPAIIRIGSDGKPAFSSPSKKKSPLPAREVAVSHTLQTSPSRRLSSNASGSSSPDSLSSGGGGPGAKFSFEGTRRGPQQNGQSVGDGERGFKHTSSDSTVGTGTAGKNKDLSEINKRLSMEVDQILMDLSPPPPSTRFSSLPHHGHLRHSFSGGLLPLHRRDDRSLQSNLEGIQKEEKELNVQVSQLTDKREKLSHELHDLISQVQQMQVGFQTLGRGSQTRSWGRLTSPPTYHTRSDSAPIRSPSPTSSSPENSLPPLSEVSPEPAILRKTNKPSERGLDGYRPHVYSPDLGRSSYHSGSKFHDPLAEYHHSTTGPDTPRDTSDHRLSVAW